MWRYYEREELINTPSFKDGVDAKTEFRYRSEGVKFIRFIGAKMDLGYNTIATGVVFFHRFYMAHSFKDFPRYVTACSSLFLAGKAEETPKRCKDLVEAAKSLLTEDVFKTFGENAKEEVMTFEKVLLKTINFEFSVEHPYKYLLKYGKYLRGDKAKVEKVVQRAWNFMNDSLCTTLCVQWEPELIAIALIRLATKMNCFHVLDWKGKKPNQKKWWDLFVEDLNKDILDDIGHQVLNIYSAAKAPLIASLPNAGKKPPKPKARIIDTNTPPPAASNPNVSSASTPKKIIAPVSNVQTPKMNSPVTNVVYLTAVPPPNLSVPPPPMNLSVPPPNFKPVHPVVMPPDFSVPPPSISAQVPQVPFSPYKPSPNFPSFTNGTPFKNKPSHYISNDK